MPALSRSRTRSGISPEHPAVDRRGDKEKVKGQSAAFVVKDARNTASGTRSTIIIYTSLDIAVKRVEGDKLWHVREQEQARS